MTVNPAGGVTDVMFKSAVPLLPMVKVCVTGAPTSAAPKSVSSLTSGVVSPALMALPLPLTLISGPTGLTRQATSKLKTLTLPASLVIETVALKLLAAAASHCRSTGVDAPTAIKVAGVLVMVKPAPTVIALMFRVSVPVLLTVKVCVTGVPTVVVPKSVSSVVLGVTSPLAMMLPLPVTAIVGAPVTRQVTSNVKLGVLLGVAIRDRSPCR